MNHLKFEAFFRYCRAMKDLDDIVVPETEIDSSPPLFTAVRKKKRMSRSLSCSRRREDEETPVAADRRARDRIRASYGDARGNTRLRPRRKLVYELEELAKSDSNTSTSTSMPPLSPRSVSASSSFRTAISPDYSEAADDSSLNAEIEREAATSTKPYSINFRVSCTMAMMVIIFM